MNPKPLLLCLFLVLTACNSSTQHDQPAQQEDEVFIPPAPGTVVAAEATVIRDELNSLDFKVRVEANEHTRKGTYTIFVVYGNRENSSMFTLPRGGAHLPVSIRKEDEHNFIVGFTYLGEFFDYYRVSFIPGHPPAASVKIIKAYALQ